MLNVLLLEVVFVIVCYFPLRLLKILLQMQCNIYIYILTSCWFCLTHIYWSNTTNNQSALTAFYFISIPPTVIGSPLSQTACLNTAK